MPTVDPHVEIPIPVAKQGEVLLKLEATSLNPVDWRLQHGLLRPLLPLKFPFIPGEDVAREVIEVGPSVQNFKQGDKVVSMLSVLQGGGLAEYAVAKANLTVARPPEVSAAEGAGIVIAGLTALQALTKTCGLKLDASSRNVPPNILITAASGGVGLYAVQLAKLAKAHVTATCGSRNVGLVKSLGADEVLDYTTPEGTALRSPSGRKYDVVLHCGPTTPWHTFEQVLTETGTLIELTPGVAHYVSAWLKKLMCSKKEYVPFLMVPTREELELLMGLLKEGKVKTVVDSTYPRALAHEAWARSMGGHATGKIIVIHN
ncbi:putative quinone-oxidoreductase-like protein [Nymphaea thermarum]|nr:putative quinone-oxidoreductase-like protein [Nymphaea thermarum]